MPRGKWVETPENIAKEAYAVLIAGHKATRSSPGPILAARLADPAIYTPFLKECLDYDESADLKRFRKGMLLAVTAIGVSRVAKKAGFSRVSLYRMLTAGGNPRLKNLLGLLQALGLRFWIVDDEFIRRRIRLIRPKDQPSEEHPIVSKGRQIKTKEAHEPTNLKWGWKPWD